MCYLAGDNGIAGGQRHEWNGMHLLVMKWEEHLHPWGGTFGVALEKMMVMSGLVLVRNLMMQTKFYRHAYTN